jgi:DNA-binding CsgD family transcriptional regulator
MRDAAFVGRRDELRALGGLFEHSAPVRVAIVDGEPGMGKSTLLDESLRLFGTSWTVVRAAPTPAERSAAWGTVRLLLTGGVRELADRSAVEIGADLLRATGLAGAPERGPGDPSRATYAFAALVEQLAAATRLLVVVDDAHWVDPASAGALTFAMRGCGHWMLARRPGAGGPLAQVVANPTETVIVDVGPFEEHELEQLAREETGRLWNGVELRRLRELSGGTPLHARELVRAYPAGGALDAARLPTGLGELFGAKAQALEPEHVDIVAAVALMRRPNLAELYAAFGDVPGERIESALGAAEQIGLLHVSTHGSTAGVEFDHALTRRAVADRLGGVAQARIHRRLAGATADADARAWHLGLGSVGPDADVSAELEAAGRRVAALGDPVQAAELLTRAVALTPQADRGHYIRRAALAGHNAVEAGDWERALELLEPVVHELGDRPEGPSARASYVVAVNRVHGVKPSIAAIEEVVDAATTDAERAELLAKLVRVNLFVDVLDAEQAAERALIHAEQSGDARIVLAARLGFDHVRCLRGDHVDLSDYLAIYADDQDRMSYSEIGYTPRACFEELIQFHDVHDVALATSRATYELGRATGNVSDVNNGLNQLLGVTRRSGDWPAMRRWAAEFDAMATGNHEELTGVTDVDTLWLLAATGEHALIASSIPAILDEADGTAPIGMIPVLSDTGFARLAIGDLRGAVELLARAKATADAMHHADLRSAGFHADLVEALVTLGRLDEADAVAGSAEQIAARSRWPFSDLEAARCRGMVLLAQGATDDAVDLLEAAEPAWPDIARPFEVARAYLLLGAARRRAGTRARAREALNRAELIFTSLGSRPWLARVADERQMLGGRDAAGDPNALSEAERQVGELVRAGRSNKDIAAELFVSLRTVESHLTRIYRKVGVKSRSEFLARRGDDARHRPA